MKEKLIDRKETLENMEEKKEIMRETTAEEAGNGQETTAEEAGNGQETTAEEQGNIQATLVEEAGNTEETTAEALKSGKDSKGNERKAGRNKLAGWIEVAVALILAALSIWMFMNTRGTRLLYVSVAVGRVSKYYWIFLAAAAVFALLGIFTMKRTYRKDRKKLPEQPAGIDSGA